MPLDGDGDASVFDASRVFQVERRIQRLRWSEEDGRETHLSPAQILLQVILVVVVEDEDLQLLRAQCQRELGRGDVPNFAVVEDCRLH